MDIKDIILRNLTEEEVLNNKPFSCFGWEGKGAYSFISISDGYWESAKILLEKMNIESNSNDIVDTLIYPLFFNYRHSIETYLKAIFFDYGSQTDEARKKFLKQGHKLLKLWEKLRPIIDEGIKHVGSSVNIDAVEHYIKSINEFDTDSIVMRYPINKKLKSNKTQCFRFDFVNFGERMNELCYALRQLYIDLSNQMTEMSTSDELDKLLTIFKKYESQINHFLSILKKESGRESKSLDFSIGFEGIKTFGKSESLKFLNDCVLDLLILLTVLYNAGHLINEKSVRLAVSSDIRKLEFVSFYNQLMGKYYFSFGNIPERSNINIYDKTASSLIVGLSTSIEILRLT